MANDLSGVRKIVETGLRLRRIAKTALALRKESQGQRANYPAQE